MSTVARSGDNPLTEDNAARTLLALSRIVRVLRTRNSMSLSPSQVSALATIEEHGAMRISALATHESMGASVATRIVASLEEENLLERRIDPEDRRASLIDLSAKGRSTLRELWHERTLGLRSRLEHLTQKERCLIEAALPALEKVARDA